MSNMSKIIEKTFSTFPSLLSSTLKGRETNEDATYEFKNFMKKISSFTSREEEITVIGKELNHEKDQLSKPNISAKEKKECLTRLLYCHMMGYDVCFAYIHAVKLAQQGNLLEKRTGFDSITEKEVPQLPIIPHHSMVLNKSKKGYLLCSIFLDEKHELSMLLINSIQKDLRSTNILEVCTALTSACQLVSTEMIPALLPMIQEKLTHNKEVVRKKAVICLQKFNQKAPEQTQHIHHLFEKALCDKDPGVMWACLHFYIDVVQSNPSKYRKLVGVLTEILMQVISRKLPTDYDYHSVPAPWLTIHLLKLLAQLGHSCESTSIQIYPVVKEVLQRTEPTQRMGLAVIYECLETICRIYPQTVLLEHAAKCVARFLSAKNINLRFLGLKALSKIVAIDSRYALDHQSVVMECLEHQDITVKTQTFSLLLQMANPENISVISGKLLDCLKQAQDKFTERDLVCKLLELSKRYQLNANYINKVVWYLNTVNEVIKIAPDHIPDTLVQEVVEVFEDKSDSLHKYAAEVYWNLLQQEDLVYLLVELSAWIVSLYWHNLDGINSVQVSSCLLSWLPRCTNISTQKVVIQGLRRLLSHIPENQVTLFVESIQASVKTTDRHIYQMLKELQFLGNHQSVLAAITNSSSNVKMDFSLSFLDDYVSESLEKGASPYKPPMYRQSKNKGLGTQEVISAIRYDTYDSNGPGSLRSSSLAKPSSSVASLLSEDGSSNAELQLKGVKRVWGKEGFRKPNKDGVPSSRSNDTANDEMSVQQSAEEKQRAEFQAALFSGITASPDKSLINNQVEHKSNLEYQLLTDEPELSSNIFSTNYTLTDDSALSIGEKDFTFSANESQKLEQTIQGANLAMNSISTRLHPNEDMYKYDPRKTREINNQSQFSHILKQHNYDTDSLDGSPDKEGPPMLFQSDHVQEEEFYSLGPELTLSEQKSDPVIIQAHKTESSELKSEKDLFQNTVFNSLLKGNEKSQTGGTDV